jgi:cysteinyl-tRNA synthetase
MPLALYDTMTREKRAFVPRDPNRVTMYVCGPTVYNHIHIGNARPVVVFDVLFRLLRARYGAGKVVYARNITDVDDKINAKAQAEGVDIKVITDRYTESYHAAMDGLGTLRPTLEPRATQHIPAMQEQIAALLDKGHAYAAEGHVLFDTQSYEAYGKLSGRSLDDMIAGARVEVATYKRHPADFVLWKPSKPGEPVWDSAWGPGRPGWHIECSAMIATALGLPIDIHGGGIDLVFPHHENELAQGECACGGEFARYWMHNGFLDMAGEKMSKSLGNVVIPHDLLKTVPGEVLRWALLSAHYRQPLDWTADLVIQSRRSLDRLYGALQRAADVPASQGPPPQAFVQALEDDLNTPRAVAELFALAKAVETGEGDAREAAKGDLLAAGALLGFLQAEPNAWFAGAADDDLRERVEALLVQRTDARKSRDWATADRIRDELSALNVVVMDGPEGATWRLKESEPT